MGEITHYRAYKPRPFARDDRENTTILFGGLTWKHERLIQGTLQNLGYKAEPLPNIARPDLEVGKELIDVGACCPTIFTTGNLVRFLRSKVASHGPQEVGNKYVFLTAGSCGPCRFGQYHESYEMALDGMGLRDFRLFLLAMDELDQGARNGDGLEINMPLSLGIIWGLLCADLVTDLEYMTRPYEVKSGQTDLVLRETTDYLYEVFKNRPLRGTKWGALAWHLLTDYFTRALREVRRQWETIEVNRLQVKPKVKITGEIWLQTHEGEGNYNIKQWLEEEGAETVPPPIAVWLDFLLHSPKWAVEEQGSLAVNARRKLATVGLLTKIYRGTYNRMRKALGNLPHELPNQEEMKRLAHPFYHAQLRGGEGHMLVGKALDAYHHRKAHMICELSPYGCLPNTMSIGSMANVLGKYPDLLYAPIEIKGDAEVHALSRCQMILTEAKRRAQAEFESVMDETGLTREAVRRYEEKHPEVTKSTYRVPHYGFAGTAANYIYHLSQRELGPRAQ
jgi:predicted nucleotide-binding protein (sugar kinase/HSP70/actin superfamily)